MKNRYKNILKKDPELLEAVKQLSYDNMDSFYKISLSVIAPSLVMYVHWILCEAKKRNIEHLYFFARDGYLLYHIAKVLCKKMNIDTECSYFYCSRYSLRMAAYRFFDDSAYEKLFLYSYELSAYNMLKRAGFSSEERYMVYDEIGYDKEKEHDIIVKTEFSQLCEKIKNSEKFSEIITKKSDSAYSSTMEYIVQERFDRFKNVGIVDLGWTGSLQYTLKRLFSSAGIDTHITGFYIGMLDSPPKAENSEYITWLFDENTASVKSWFSHNLLECICSAPHGTTMGYTYDKSHRVKPVLSESENSSEGNLLLKELSEKFAFECDMSYEDKHRKIALKLLKQLMFHPTEYEVYTFRDYCLCDDVGEQYHNHLVQIEENAQYRKQMIFYRTFHRESTDSFYWYCGSVKVSNLLIKTYYKYMYFLTKYVIIKFRQRVS